MPGHVPRPFPIASLPQYIQRPKPPWLYRLQPVPAFRQNTAEGGSNGIAVTQGVGGNSGGASGTFWDLVTIGTSATVAFDNSPVAHGGMSYNFATAGTSALAVVGWTGLGPWPQCFGRMYVNASAFTTIPSLARFRGTGGTVQNLRLGLDSTGHIQVRDTGNSVVATSTNALTANTWARIEWDITGGANSQAYIYIYLTPDAPVGSHTERLVAQGNFGPANIDEVNFGVVVATVNATSFNLDDLLISDIGLPGPAIPAPTPVLFGAGAAAAPVGWGLAGSATGAQIFAAPAAPVVVSAVAGPQPLVVTPQQVWSPPTTAQLFVAPAGSSAPQPLVVGPSWSQWPAPVPAALFAAPPAPPAPVATPAPVVAGPPFAWPYIPPVTLSASQPLGNPAVPTPPVLLVTPPTPPVLVPPVHFSTNTPLGNPAVPTASALVVGPPPAPPLLPRPLLSAGSSTTASGQPLVVGPPFAVVPVPGALISSTPAAAPVVATGTPGPLVVSPPWQPVPIPVPQVSASQPLGNPAVGTPGPIVVGTPFAAKVPGALLFGPGAPTAPIVTGSTPGPLVVTPPFTPVPVPQVYLSASQPLGNPAVPTPQPMVVSPPARPHRTPPVWITSGPAGAASTTPGPLVVGPAFTLAPVPGARVFAAPSAPAAPSVGTPGPLVIGPPWQPVAIPKAYLSASYPLGRPAVGSPQPMVVSPPHRWPHRTPVLLSTPFGLVASCSTSRPGTGTTTRPSSGMTSYAAAMTSRPSSGTTTRPSSGDTPPPC